MARMWSAGKNGIIMRVVASLMGRKGGNAGEVRKGQDIKKGSESGGLKKVKAQWELRVSGVFRGSLVYTGSFTFMSSTVSVLLEVWSPGLSIPSQCVVARAGQSRYLPLLG